MKKLMTAVAAAATALITFSAAHADAISGTSFESLALGQRTISNLTSNDDGDSSGNVFWFATTNAEEVAGVVTNESPYTGTELRPAAHTATNEKYLSLDTSTAIYRTVNKTDGATALGGLTGTAIGDGLYLDTLVQFTAADGEFTEDLDSGDKIAISYVEADDGTTNFVVRAGYVTVEGQTATITQKNYKMNAIANFDKTAWHRLTVRSISNVGCSAAPVGFVVYVDGEALTYKVSEVPGNPDYLTSLNSTVQTYLYNSEKHALLPSILSSLDTNYNTLSAVAFKGNGCVDDISFTTTTPSFIKEDITVTVAWDAGVASVTINDGSTNITPDVSAGSTNLTLASGITALTVTATYVSGKQAGTWTCTAGTLSGSSWTFEAGATLNIVSMTPLFQVGKTSYGTFAEALAAAVSAGTSETPATIKVLADIADVLTLDSGYIEIDLNGKTIQAPSGKKYSIVNTGATLRIVDSVSGGEVAKPESGTGSMMVRGNSAITTITAGKYSGTIVVTGLSEVSRADVLTVTGGTFYDVDYADAGEGNFYLTDCVDTETYTISDPVDAYFTVSNGETPTSYAITITTPENGKVTTDVATAAEGATVTITATADTGYAVDTVTVATANVTDVGDGTYTFTMPAAAVTVTVTFKASGGLDPSSGTTNVVVTAESPDAALTSVTNNITVPSGSTVDKGTYAGYFTYSTTSAGEGSYNVAITGIDEAPQTTAKTTAMNVINGSADAVTVPAGLYYKITTYTELGGKAVSTAADLSDGTAIKVTKPGTTQGFIKVQLGSAAFAE